MNAAVRAAAHANDVTPLAGLPARRMRVGGDRIALEETPTKAVVTRIGPRGSIYGEQESNAGCVADRDPVGRGEGDSIRAGFQDIVSACIPESSRPAP